MKKIVWISFIVIALILGILIGSIMFGRTNVETSKRNVVNFVVDASNKNMASIYPSNCREEYKDKYGYEGDCEITKVTTQVGKSLIGEFGCNCWQE